MNTTIHNNPDGVETVPLRTWLEEEIKKEQPAAQKNNNDIESLSSSQLFILRKTTVAYAVAELLRRAITAAPLSADKICFDNFVVRTKKKDDESASFSTSPSTADILGVDMVSEMLSLTIIEPSYMNHLFDEGGEEVGPGRYLEVCISPSKPPQPNNTSAVDPSHERTVCHLFGILLYQLYSNLDPFPMTNLLGVQPMQQDTTLLGDDDNGDTREPVHKKAATSDAPFSASSNSSTCKKLTYSALHDLGSPPSIIRLVQNLVESKSDHPMNPQNICSSMREACNDLHLLLHEPDRFLFTRNQFEGGNAQLQLRKNKLYGREKEVSAISESFNRVCTGNSEAIFIGGFSGAGKTRLVESVMPLVDVAGGCVLTHKFDPISKGRSLLELISAFDNLCLLVQRENSPQELEVIVSRLTESFGSDLSLLGRLLPNVYSLLPHLEQFKQVRRGDNQMNFQSVCFILRQFMKIVSSKSHPVMLFLDDLQWSDSTALGVIHHILSDKGSDISCFFVGSYRSNEVSSDHPIFSLMKDLEASKVSTQKLMLEGVKYEDMNTLISDALCTFPRTTWRLTNIIYEKTQGNPFFFLEFLHSLVDRGLLRYSLRLEIWQWDEGKIGLENITDNVLYLLSSKMNVLSTEVQMALKVISSFGIKVDEKIVHYLSCTDEYSNIMTGIEEAKLSGFITKAGEPSCYSFSHDKVREAAYGLISDDEKHEFHSKLGMALIHAAKGEELDDNTVFTIVCQINRNLSSLKQSSSLMRVEVSSLNYKAGIAAMKRSDYVTASYYLSLSTQLLPDNHWLSNYSLSLQAYMATAKASYSTGDTDKSQAALNVILKEATCIEDKLDAYYLFVNLLHSQERGEEAYTICQNVLTQLGEKIPENVTPEESKAMVQETVSLVKDLSEERLRAMKEMDEQPVQILKFFTLLAHVSWFRRPGMIPYVCLRNAKITMENGLCKYSLVGFVQLSFILCNAQDISKTSLGCKIGATAMSVLNNFDYSGLKSMVANLYSYIHQHSHPLQKVAESVLKGFEFGIASGDTASAFFNATQIIRLSIIGGSKLPTLLRETDKYLSLIGHNSNTMSRAYLLTYRQTISILIDKGVNTGVAIDQAESRDMSEEMYTHRRSVVSNFHQGLQSFWIGYNERCYHFIEKLLEMRQAGRFHRLMALFYHGLNAFILMRKGKLKVSKLKQIPQDALRQLRAAEELSKWNYRNKVFLLQAELYSLECKNDEARAAYAAAITSARASRFIHEQGLACECAGFHCIRVRRFQEAWNFFNEAKLCYSEWGSLMKVDFCNRQLSQITNS